MRISRNMLLVFYWGEDANSNTAAIPLAPSDKRRHFHSDRQQTGATP
jgi:hypothetical protein